jgi:hypothetical protein
MALVAHWKKDCSPGICHWTFSHGLRHQILSTTLCRPTFTGKACIEFAGLPLPVWDFPRTKRLANRDPSVNQAWNKTRRHLQVSPQEGLRAGL